MITAIVSLAAATICFQGKCYPALVGRDTPLGMYELHKRITDSPGYGGDVLQFFETPNYVYAIHRLWLLRPAEHRAERISSSNPADRREVTGGCINVSPAVYDQLQKVTMVDIEP
jgi:hypothetical protein